MDDETVIDEMDDTVDEFDDTFEGTAENAREAYRRSRRRMRDAANELALAGIGAIALAFDTAEDTYDRLVDRGEEVRTDMQQRGNQMRAERRVRRTRLSDAMRNAMDVVLDTLSVPNKSDIDTINVKLNLLNRKLDDLQMEEGGQAIPPGEVVPPPTPTDVNRDADLAT